jgi:hypothetical protein
MIFYVQEKDFARRDTLRLGLDCGEKTFMGRNHLCIFVNEDGILLHTG